MVDGQADFGRDGYAVLRGWVGSASVERLRDAVDRLVRSPRDGACERPNNTLIPLRWDDAVVAAIVGSEGRIRSLASALGADDLRWISGYVSIKDPGSPALWWHQDWWCWDHPASFRRAPVQVAVLCYLTDTDAANGALRVLPGSHLRSAAVHAALPEAHGDSSAALDPSHVTMRDQPGQLTLGLRAGDAAVLDYRLLHSTHPNGSPLRRDCVLLSFAPSWSSLPSDIRGHLISHPSLPSREADPSLFGALARLLPSYDGPRRDLELNRNAPADFAIDGS